MRVPAYHSDEPQPVQPKVYHIFDDCPEGQQIPARNRVSGKGGYRRCKNCTSMKNDGHWLT